MLFLYFRYFLWCLLGLMIKCDLQTPSQAFAISGVAKATMAQPGPSGSAGVKWTWVFRAFARQKFYSSSPMWPHFNPSPWILKNYVCVYIIYLYIYIYMHIDIHTHMCMTHEVCPCAPAKFRRVCQLQQISGQLSVSNQADCEFSCCETKQYNSVTTCYNKFFLLRWSDRLLFTCTLWYLWQDHLICKQGGHLMIPTGNDLTWKV